MVTNSGSTHPDRLLLNVTEGTNGGVESMTFLKRRNKHLRSLVRVCLKSIKYYTLKESIIGVIVDLSANVYMQTIQELTEKTGMPLKH